MMDWTNLAGQFAQIGLPALGGLFGGPLGSAIGGIVGKAVAGALGVEPTPQAVSAAVQADPSGAQLRLAEIEAETKRRQAELDDVASARAMETAAIQSHHEVVWVPVVFSALNYIFVAGIIAGVAMGWLREDGIIVGWVLGAATTAYQFWLGSSSASRNKDAQLGAVLQQAAAPLGRAVANAVRR
ncbi:hypothetical protein [Methylobacterium nigriterrae]|uniref:hypothetical protein n=1 Tax=Methylobacterium nigriterrae TaxID=3127512 RepID=UPI0030133D2A